MIERGRHDYDAVIVGAGHNALVCAYYLAKHGVDVALFEARAEIGGACKTEELIPGYRFSTCANWVGWWRSKIIDDLGLLERGLEVGGTDVSSRVLPDGSGFVWWPDPDRLDAEIRRHSPRDAEQWGVWSDFWDEVARELGPWILSYPPGDGAERVGSRFRSLMGESLASIVDRFFSSDVMRDGIVAPHDVGSVHEAGSAGLMALQEAMRRYSETTEPVPSGYVRGGMGEVTRAMAEAAVEAGAEIFTDRAVGSVVCPAGKVAGLRFEDGELVSARHVILGCDPLTSMRLVGDALDVELVSRVRDLKRWVAPLKLHCAMRRLPEWSAFPDSKIPHEGLFFLSRSRQQSEEAWEAASTGELPDNPNMVIMTPSIWDPSVAPAGEHTISVWTLYAPVAPREGRWQERRSEMLELMLTAIERDAPEFRECLVDAVLLTPLDIEERVGLPGGNIHHIDVAPDQILWRRPLPELARYRFPVRGLYGCGASHHPYGEVSGAPGHNAAHAVLEDCGIVGPSWQQVAAS